MNRTIEIVLTLDEKLAVVAEMVQKQRRAVTYLLENGGRYGCPFPGQCKRFPCEDMWCNSDTCSNGYTICY